MDPLSAYFLGVATALGGLTAIWLVLRILGPWITARASGVPLTMLNLIGMRMRKTDPGTIVSTLVILAKLGEMIPVHQLEAIYMTLPHNQRNPTALLRAARPELVDRLKQER